MIHQDQKNVDVLCQHASFVDSGFQSFCEQVRGVPATGMAEAAFFAGAALALKLTQYFKDAKYSEREVDSLMYLIYLEVNEFMQKRSMHIEWQPHVPKRWQQ